MENTTDFFDIFQDDPSFRDIMKRLLESSMEFSFNGVTITEAKKGYPIVYVNPAFCELTGYGPHELIGKSPTILQGPETDPEVLKRLQEQVPNGELFHGQAINYRKDGSRFMMEWKIIPIHNKEGEITHHLAIQRDANWKPVGQDFAP